MVQFSKKNNGLLGLKRGSYKPQKDSAKKPRVLAKEKGELYYFTGKPCVRNHISKRLTSDGSCFECAKGKRRELYLKHKDRLKLKTKEWKTLNTEWIQNYRKEYQKRRPEVKRCSENRRNAKKRNAEGTFSSEDISNLFELQKGLCSVCGKDLKITGYHIDHKNPLSRGGSNWPNNLQLLCPHDNVTKHTKTDEEYREFLSKAANG